MAMRQADGDLARVIDPVLARDTRGGRVKVDIAPIQAELRRGTHRTGRAQLHRPAVVEAIEHTADVLIVTGLRGECFAQKQVGILIAKERFSALQGTSAAEGVDHETEHPRPRIDLHLGGDVMMHQVHPTELIGVGLDDRHMLDVRRFDVVGDISHVRLQQQLACSRNLLVQAQPCCYGAATAAKMPRTKIRLIKAWGVRNVCQNVNPIGPFF
jgi:hypothetical protein